MCAPCRTPLIWVLQFLLLGVLQGESVNRVIESEQLVDRDPPTYMTGCHVTGAHITGY